MFKYLLFAFFVSSQAIAGGCQNGAVYKAETQGGTYTLVHNFPGLFDAHITMDVDGEPIFTVAAKLTCSNGISRCFLLLPTSDGELDFS